MNRLSREELLEAAELHLTSLGTTLWGQAWCLWDKQFPDAIAWLADEVAAVLDRLEDPLPVPAETLH